MADRDRLRQLVIGDDALVAYSKVYPDAVDRLVQALDRGDPTMLALGDSVIGARDIRLAAMTSVLSEQFGLTPAEAAVSAMLCGGTSLKEIAGLRGVSVTTVRNQVKSVMTKTGVRRQSELVARLLAYL